MHNDIQIILVSIKTISNRRMFIFLDYLCLTDISDQYVYIGRAECVGDVGVIC